MENNTGTDFFQQLLETVGREKKFSQPLTPEVEEFFSPPKNAAPPPPRRPAAVPQPTPVKPAPANRPVSAPVKPADSGRPISTPAVPKAAASSGRFTPELLQVTEVPEFVAAADLEALRQALGDCQRCGLAATRQNLVFGEGDPHARLMFVGEGPGADEDAQGRPFVGRAGELLTKMITAMHLAREQVYIANVVKCRPPQNRVPQNEEAAACLPILYAQIRLVHPEVIVALGATGARALLRTGLGINALRGRWTDWNGIPVMPTFHPAYLLRDPSRKRDAWNDLQLVMAKLGL